MVKRRNLGACAVGVALASASLLAAPASGQGPFDERIPPPWEVDLAGRERSVVVRFHPDREPDSRVVRRRPHTHTNDSGPLTVNLRRSDGSVIETWRTNDFGGEREEPEAGSDDLRIAVPLYRDLDTVEVVDARNGDERRARVGEVIGTYCQSDPNESECSAIDLALSAWLGGAFGTATEVVPVGAVIEIPVNVQVQNTAVEPALIDAVLALTYPGTTVSASGHGSWPSTSLGGSSSVVWATTYAVKCLEVGDAYLRWDALVAPAGPTYVDLSAGNDSSSPALRVSCVAPTVSPSPTPGIPVSPSPS